MINYLCALTPEQWRLVNRQPVAGSTQHQPEGYKRAGLYEGKDRLWLVQYAGNHTGYRYWNYCDVFSPDGDQQRREEQIEVAQKALDEAARLRQRAEELLDKAGRLEQVASDAFNDALIRDA